MPWRALMNQSLVKQSSLDDSFALSPRGEEDDDLMDGLKSNSDEDSPPTPPRPATPTVSHRTLPWKPKVRSDCIACLSYYEKIACQIDQQPIKVLFSV